MGIDIGSIFIQSFAGGLSFFGFVCLLILFARSAVDFLRGV